MNSTYALTFTDIFTEIYGKSSACACSRYQAFSLLPLEGLGTRLVDALCLHHMCVSYDTYIVSQPYNHRSPSTQPSQQQLKIIHTTLMHMYMYLVRDCLLLKIDTLYPRSYCNITVCTYVHFGMINLWDELTTNKLSYLS